MNVVIVNDSAFVRGGADRVAFDSACALSDGGIRVTLFTAFGEPEKEVRDRPSISTVSVGSAWIRQAQGSPSAFVRGLWNFEAARRMRSVLSKLDPKETIVHIHLYSSALTASVIDSALRLGFRTVLTLHDYFITCPNGAYFEFPKAKPCERNALSASCLGCNCDSRRRTHKVWRVARTWIQNRVAAVPGRISAYLAVSNACATLARRDLPERARIEVIPNVVSVERRSPLDAARNRAYVFAGRLESYKGPQLLAEAAKRLRIPVVFCGAGPLETELRRLCPDAEFTGWLQSDRLLEVLRRSRAFVFPSVYRETFGLAAAEALALGLPVVASRGTAAEEFVIHERNGLLFDHHSVEDLSAQLGRLADDALVGRLSTEAYSGYWAAPLTLDAHVARLSSLYASVLDPASDRMPVSGDRRAN